MAKGTTALLELPAETVSVARRVGVSLAAVSAVGLMAAIPFVVAAGLWAPLGAAIVFDPSRRIQLSFAVGYPLAWLGSSFFLSAALAMTHYATLLRLCRAEPPVSDVKFLGLALLYVPVIAAWLLPVPDFFWSRSFDKPPELAPVAEFSGLAVALIVLLVAATRFTLTPAVYLSDRSIGLRAALRRSRELAVGRRAIFVTVSLLPVAVAAAGLVSFGFGEKLTFGGQILGDAFSRQLARLVGFACVAVTPLLAAALKSAALNIATRPD
ncbi:MAG TPA: hypothetical protein VFF73_23670 [Planctomycetota bacterium]|nr:hypothetical protein [Planctomycetota bacterium]